MIFSKSLYYPHIEIPDEKWLKTAALYWDTMQTIVPESIEDPYQTDIAKKLYDAEILIPLRVSSHMPVIMDLESDVIDFLSSQEGAELFTGASTRGGAFLHPEKLPSRIRRLMLHPEKMSYEIRHMIQDMDIALEGRGGFLDVAPEFASYYMTLLANRLSEDTGAGLVTGTNAAHNLSIKARADANLTSMMHMSDRYRHEFGGRRRRHDLPRYLRQGALYNLLIEKIHIDPETPVEKILEFKSKHSDELSRFRSEIESLTSSLPEEMSLQAMQQHLSDIHTNKIIPALNDLKGSLNGNKIKWVAMGGIQIALMSVATTSVIGTLGLSTPQALLVGAGLSVAASTVLFNNEKSRKDRGQAKISR
ncbi:DUF6236 family protein [Psychrobium sp. nBUS_13]|uniref:DUF6236 family protein n=1 Tax=Psychrobium sp. nBUS_13 TaxID=3395319 RepID=UPI003EC122FC